MAEEINLEQSWDVFFYYGQNDIELENRFDVYQVLMQPERSLFYNRRESAGLEKYENNPNTISLQVFAKFSIANALAYRNFIVTDGSNNTKDRRIAVSQEAIGFYPKDGELDITLLYFSLYNYKPSLVDVPLTY